MRASSSVILAPSESISSARAIGAAASPETTSATKVRIIMGSLLLRRRLLLGGGILVGDHVLAKVDRRAILRIGGHGVALLEADDLELQLLALAGGERVAGARGELVALEVGEDRAVALVDHLHRE